jgi:hypothetical protein
MKKWLVVAAMLAIVMMIASCSGADSYHSGSGDGGGGSAVDAGSAENGAGDEGGGEDGSGDSDGGTGSGATEAQPIVLLDPSTREIIYTVDMTVEVDDVADAVRRAAALAASSGGFVAAETSEGDESASLTLRVPTETHSDIVARLEGFGEVQNRYRTAEDVTEEVVDVEARITSQRRSIERIRALLDEAADIDDVVRIESELAARETELDSLLRRQEELAKLTALATVSVTFVASGSDAGDEAEVGFISGLRNGWNALVDGARVATAIIGALLPFAVVLGVIGLPLLWGVRRRKRVAPTAASDAQSSA